MNVPPRFSFLSTGMPAIFSMCCASSSPRTTCSLKFFEAITTRSLLAQHKQTATTNNPMYFFMLVSEPVFFQLLPVPDQQQLRAGLRVRRLPESKYDPP